MLHHEPIDWTGPDIYDQEEPAMSDQTRAAIYAILAAITALVVAYGLITQDMAALWVLLIKSIIDAAALLLARRNVPSVIAKRAAGVESST